MLSSVCSCASYSQEICKGGGTSFECRRGVPPDGGTCRGRIHTVVLGNRLPCGINDAHHHCGFEPAGYHLLFKSMDPAWTEVAAHYLPFATLYGMRMFLFLAGILIAAGVVIAHYFSGTFSLGAWVSGLTLFVFAWIGRAIAVGEASAPSTH
jgi:hypothetical protein